MTSATSSTIALTEQSLSIEALIASLTTSRGAPEDTVYSSLILVKILGQLSLLAKLRAISELRRLGARITAG